MCKIFLLKLRFILQHLGYSVTQIYLPLFCRNMLIYEKRHRPREIMTDFSFYFFFPLLDLHLYFVFTLSIAMQFNLDY